MLGVSLSHAHGLCTVTTKYLIEINDFSSFVFCKDKILVSVSSSIALHAIEVNQ